MPTYSIKAKCRAYVYYTIEASDEEEAKTKWETVDPSMGRLDEDEIDHEEFESIELIPDKPKQSDSSIQCLWESAKKKECESGQA